MVESTSIFRTKFQVADVEPAATPLETLPASMFLKLVAQSPVLVSPDADLWAVAAADFHPLIAAAQTAFKLHYPLALSPDMIWLAVLQGVAQHVNNHREQLRPRLVHHQTRIELVVKTNLEALPQTENEMHSLTGMFVNEILKHVLPDKRFLFASRFSTSTPATQIANAVALMDGFQAYFDYVFVGICGIPSIVLEGPTDDWRLLKQQVTALHESDLDLQWWTKHLVPLCDQFIDASMGKVDRAHWNNIAKLKKRYGTEDLNGWLLKFIPYIRKSRDAAPTLRNPVLELTEFPGETTSETKAPPCTSDTLPSGISCAPVKVQSGSETQPLDFIAGFTCVTQDPETFALRPVIGWAICEGRRIDFLIEKILLNHQAGPKTQLTSWEIAERFPQGLIADFARFYSEMDGALIERSNRPAIRILPVNQLKKACNDSDLLDPSHPVAHPPERRQQLIQSFFGKTEIQLEPDEMREFKARDCAGLIIFAEQLNSPIRYLTGSIHDKWPGPSRDDNAPHIFEWDGTRDIAAFKPVANSLTEWLGQIL